MAASITLWSRTDERLHRFINATIDAVPSHTIIKLHNEDTVIRLFDTMTSVTVRDRKTVLTYESGFYIVVLK